jgi:DNA-binding NtrC family response regulator
MVLADASLMPQSHATTEQLSNANGTLTLDVRGVVVEVVQGPDLGAHVVLRERRVLVGRAGECDLRLSDPAVSAMHLELALDPKGVAIRNLASRNGVQVGGARVEDAVVEPTARLVIGKSVLKLEPTEAAAQLPYAAVPRTGGLVGRSLKMKMLFGLLRSYAGSDAPVLVEGATGTGKELAARALHDLSPRARGPYEIVDCGAIPPHLMESELFGVVRGAYTGADATREGSFERADGGTLVLDEIGELPLELQPKLLGALERGLIRRLGDERARRVNVRVIATTNRVLAREVQAGHFRQDLYFRLSVLRVAIPPLRDRKEDIPLLAQEFLGPSQPLPQAWRRVLEEYDWPGNVRELRNVLERAAAQASTGGDLSPLFDGEGPRIEPIDAARRNFERNYLRSLLVRTGHNVRRAAELAGLTRQGLYGLLSRAGLRPDGGEES